MRVSVVGGSEVTDDEATIAESVGRELADRGHVTVCGGLGGTMEAVCRGAKRAGGETIGILPVAEYDAANPHVDVAIATGMGHARNALVAMNGDGVIALAGGPGTLSEIGLGLAMDRPVVGVGTHDVAGVVAVDGARAAVDRLEASLGVD